jgi:hypothetical protein
VAKSKRPKIIGSDNPITLARQALADTDGASNQRQWRAFVREKHLAKALLEADKTKRALRKQVKELEVALAKACDWALDSADVIADEGICDPEDDEDGDFRDVILRLRELSKQPEAERHVERRKARERETKPELPVPAPAVVNPERIGIDSDGEYMTDGKRW